MTRTTRSRILRSGIIFCGIAALSLGSGPALSAPVPAPAQAAAGAAAKPAPVRAIEKLPFPKLNPIIQPEVVRATLPNGIKLLLVEDHDLPKIGMRAIVRGGMLAEPAGKKGLVQLLGACWRTGGTEKMAGDQVDEFLERIGASIEGGAGDDDVQLHADTLTEKFDDVLPLFVDFLLHPAFADDKVDLAKTHLRSEISRRNDEVMQLAGREFRKLIYGADSPYARQLEYADLGGLSRADLVAYHTQVFRPERTILAAWGDFDANRMKETLTRALAGWKADGTAPQLAKPSFPPQAGSINYIEKKDIAQTYLYMGHQGLRYDDPDYPAVQVMNIILGEGFSSRIFNKVRTEKGLAYGAGGGMSPAFDHPGTFYFFTSTKPETTTQALNAVLEEVRKIREAPVTAEELQRAKDSYLNAFAFDFDSKAKIVNRMMTYDFYGYPSDFNTRIRDLIEKVNADDVLRVAKQRLHPEKLAILAVGKAEAFDKPLATVTGYGDVKTIDITIPTPKVTREVAPATPETLARGKELVKAAAAAKGAALASLKDFTSEGSASIQSPMGAMELKVTTTFVLPDRQASQIQSPMGLILQVIDGEASWMKFGPNVQDLPASQAEDQRRQLFTEAGAIMLVRDAADRKLTAQSLGPDKFGGHDAEAVLVKIGEKPLRLYLDPKTAEVLGVSGEATTQEGPAELVLTFTDYKDFGGLRVPAESAATANGKPVATNKLTSMKINAGFDPKLFEKPKP